MLKGELKLAEDFERWMIEEDKKTFTYHFSESIIKTKFPPIKENIPLKVEEKQLSLF
jgi:hypothetical protein